MLTTTVPTTSRLRPACRSISRVIGSRRRRSISVRRLLGVG